MSPRPVDSSLDSRRKLEILLDISRSLGEEIQLDPLLKVMVAEVTTAMQAERSSLLLYDQRSKLLYSKVAEGLTEREIRVAIGIGVAGAAALTRQAINIPDAYADPRFNPAFDRATGFVTRSILCMPILNRNNQLVGVVQVLNKLNREAFTEDDEAFLRAICVHLGLALERAALIESYVQAERFQQTLKLAHDIQMGLVPRRFPAFPEKPELDIYALMEPALEVGGDFYDFFLLDPDHVCFVIGDVSDKGVPAALFMAMVRTAFKMSALAVGEDVAATLRRLNRFMFENNDSQMFATVFAGVLDLRTGRVEYSDGGHEPPFIARRGPEIEMLEKKGGVALGFLDDYEFPLGEFQLAPGDALILYTDGVNEAMNSASEMFRTDSIGPALRTLCGQPVAETIAKGLVSEVRRFVADAPQSDDITVLVLRFCGRP